MKVLITTAIITLTTMLTSVAEYDERELLAACITLEAVSEGELGMKAVLNVIHNRSIERKLSYTDVVLEPYQFSCFNDGVDILFAKHLAGSQWEVALNLVDILLSGYLLDITNGANHYHTTNITAPYWSDPNKEVFRFRRHVFFKL